MPAVKFVLPVLAVAVGGFALAADDKETEAAIKKQKETAAESMKLVGVSKPTVVETPALLVYSTLTEEKTKPVADTAQKAFDAAFKALKIEDKGKLWAGKLTVFVLPERKEFASFVRLIESRKPETDDTHSVKVRGGEPYAVVGAATGAKNPEAAVRDEAAAAAAVALLDQKAGVGSGTFTLPLWLHTGFGKASVMRLDGNGRLLDAHRTKVKGLFTKARVGTFSAADVWGDAKPKDAETLTVSLVEYLVYGADAAKFAKFLGGYKPDDMRQNPDTMSALEAADWKAEALDAGWKAWVMKQK